MKLDAFERLATEGEVVPLVRRIALPGGPGAARALPRALQARGSAFVLESARPARDADSRDDGWEAGQVTLLGVRPRGVWRAWGNRVEVTEQGQATVTTHEERPLDSLFKRVGRRPTLAGVPRFSGGLVGYLGWGAARWFEPKVPARLGADPSFPDAEFLLVDDLAAIDWRAGTAQLIANVEPARFADVRSAFVAATLRLDALESTLALGELGSEAASDPVTGLATGLGEATDAWGGAGFEAAVETVLGHLRAGDCMQAVLSRRLTAPFGGDPLDLYERLRRASPVPYHFLLRFEEGADERRAVIGASPELLVRVREGEVTVRPIAGTRPRGATPEEDDRREVELRGDPKELAEHVMLVDLGRNDVGRVATPGSVRVDEREKLLRFSHVMHLISQVAGTLRDDLTPLDALAAAFPAGTVSGAPKLRALEIIDALEPVPRGPYGGAVGTVCYDGSLVMAIHLRSLALAGQELRLQAGAGIVSDSQPAQELAETEAKLAGVRAALGLATGRWRRW